MTLEALTLECEAPAVRDLSPVFGLVGDPDRGSESGEEVGDILGVGVEGRIEADDSAHYENPAMAYRFPVPPDLTLTRELTHEGISAGDGAAMAAGEWRRASAEGGGPLAMNQTHRAVKPKPVASSPTENDLPAVTRQTSAMRLPSEFRQAEAADAAGPRVTNVWPSPGAIVGSLATVVVRFDEDLNAATVTDATFKVSSDRGADAAWGTSDDTYVSASVTYTAATDTATLSIPGTLPNGEYAVWLDGTSGISDVAGNALDGEYPGSEPGFPSGDGASGGDFVATLTLSSNYSGSDVPKVIPDLTTVSSTLQINDSFYIADLDVRLNITHPYVGDLNAFLIGPDGTRIELFSEVGGDGDNFNSTILDDEARTALSAGLAPFTGVFRPEGVLSDFDGKDVQGTWTLEIRDVAAEDNGTLEGWALNVLGAASDIFGPRVTGLSPAPGAALDTVSSIVATFDEDLAPGTVTETTLRVSSDRGPDRLWATADDTYVAGTVAYDAGSDTATFTPPVALGLAEYAVWLDGIEGITDVAGNALDGEWPGAERGFPSGNGIPGGDFLGTFSVATIVSYASNDAPKAIPDADMVTSTVQIRDSYSVTDLNVLVNISHAYDADLEVYLIGPRGVRVELFSEVGGSGVNFTNTTLDDEASTSITSGAAPFNGVFRPEGILSDFDGTNVQGTWTLEIRDMEAEDLGTLNSWSLIVAGYVADLFGPRVTELTLIPSPTAPSVPNIAVLFNEDLDEGTVNTGTFRVSSDRGEDTQWGTADDTYVAGTVVYDPAADSATFAPSAALASGRYAIWLDGTSGITDLTGNRLDGEYPGSGPGFPSGDGTPGGDFLGTFVVASYSASDLPKAIPDVSILTSTLQIADSFYIADVDVGLNIVHPYDGDLVASLIAPDGTRIELFSEIGGDGDDFSNTTLDDEAATLVSSESAPFTGVFRPEAALSDLDGKNVKGDWTLEIRDLAEEDYGTLEGWSLMVLGVEMDMFGPRVTGLTPTPGTAVSGVPNIVATFDEDLAPATVNAGSFKVSSNRGGDGMWGTADDTYVPGTVAYDAGTDGATFTPSVGLAAGEYAVWLDGTSSITDLAGNRLDGEWPGAERGFASGDGITGGNFLGTFSVSDVRTYSSTDVPKGIPDASSVTSTLHITDSFRITDLNVSLDISHEYDADLEAYLISPHGTRAELFSRIGGSGVNFSNTTLDDESPMSVTSGVAPFSGAFRPEGILGDLEVGNAQGTWTLEIRDAEAEDLGTLNSWSLIVGGFVPDVYGPRVMELTPVPGATVAPLGSIAVTFDEDLATATLSNQTLKILAPDDTELPGTVSYDPETDTANFTLATPLRTNGTYRVRLDGTSITDLQGNRLDGEYPGNQPDSMSGDAAPGGDFEATFVVDRDLDTIGPRVTLLTTSVSQVQAKFDEDMDQSSVNGSTFKVFAPDGTEVTGGVAYDAAEDTATFTATAPWSAHGRYRVWLDGTSSITDLAGNPLDGEFSGSLPSGDATAGGTFEATFDVLKLSRTTPTAPYTDEDGDQFKLDYRGPGSATVVFDVNPMGDTNADINSITFAGATDRTTLTSTLTHASGQGMDEGQTTIGSITAEGQKLGTLDLTLRGRGVPKTLANRTSLAGQAHIGGPVSRLLLGGDVTAQVDIAGTLKTLDIRGTLTSQFSVNGDLKSAILGALGPEARLSATGTLSSLRTLGDLRGQVQAGVDIGKVTADGTIDATLDADANLKSVFSKQDIAGVLTAGQDMGTVKALGNVSANIRAGRNVTTVNAAGRLSGNVIAEGRISTVRAGEIVGTADDLVRIIAGEGGALHADLASVKVTGGIQNAEIRATRHVKSVTAGAAGIVNTHISAGVGAGADGQYESRDDSVQAGSVTTVSTTGPLNNVVIIAGVKPERPEDADGDADDTEFGKFGETPAAQVADNGLSTGARISTLKAAQYVGDMRVIAGSDRALAVRIGKVTLRTSAASGANTLTLIRTVNGVSAVV